MSLQRETIIYIGNIYILNFPDELCNSGMVVLGLGTQTGDGYRWKHK